MDELPTNVLQIVKSTLQKKRGKNAITILKANHQERLHAVFDTYKYLRYTKNIKCRLDRKCVSRTMDRKCVSRTMDGKRISYVYNGRKMCITYYMQNTWKMLVPSNYHTSLKEQTEHISTNFLQLPNTNAT